MKLISCSCCGVVLDEDKLRYPTEEEMYHPDGSIDLNKAEWDGDIFAPKISCPVCKYEIVKGE